MLLKFIQTFLILRLISKSFSLQPTDLCLTTKYCACTHNRTVVVCENFTSFQELVFRPTWTGKVHMLSLNPVRSIFLDQHFSLNSIDFYTDATIEFNNLDGLSLTSRLFNFTRNNFHLRLIINYSNIFFLEISTSSQRLNRNQKSSTLFSYFNRIIFGSGNSFLRPIPELAFRNTRISHLQFINLDYRNKQTGFFIEHYDSGNGSMVDLSSRIQRLEFTNCHLNELSTRIMSPRVFADLKQLIAGSNIWSIQNDLFSYFKHIHAVTLELNDLGAFLTRSDNLWMQHLNAQRSHLYFNLTLVDRAHRYTFPNENICLFRHFPTNKHVIVRVQSQAKQNCSCSLLLLLHDRYILTNERNNSWLHCVNQHNQHIDYGVYFEMSCRLLLDNCKDSNDNENDDTTEELIFTTEDDGYYESSSTNDEIDTMTTKTTTKTTTSKETDMSSIWSTTITSTEALEEEVKPSSNKLVLILSISLGVVFILFVTVSLFSFFLYRKNVKLRNFKSDVSYEITTFERHLDAEHRN